MIMDSDSAPSKLTNAPKTKIRKPGIIYLSTIPTGMTVSAARHYFSKYGQVDRMYFQLLEGTTLKKKRNTFTEGWIEFKSKRKAKKVEELLNNEPVGGRRRSASYCSLWNIKYLPRFKWEYINQRLEYERLIFRKRMGAEISQVNKETDVYLRASLNSAKMKKDASKEDTQKEKKCVIFKQKLTEEEREQKKRQRMKKDEKYRNLIKERKIQKQHSKENATPDGDDLLCSIFVGGSQ